MIKPGPIRPTPSAAVAAARRAVLDQLRQAGPVPASAIRARWPLTGHQVRVVLDGLARDGLVEGVPGEATERGRVPRVALTPAGHRALGSGD